MTEKRFFIDTVDGGGSVLSDDGVPLLLYEVCVLLNELHEENEQLKQSIDRMGGRLQGLWAHYYENRWGIWSEAVEDIANELGFKIHHTYDDPISNSKSKKERVEGVKKITEILGENELIKQENKELKENVSRLINDAILEILDGQRYEGERILIKALERYLND